MYSFILVIKTRPSISWLWNPKKEENNMRVHIRNPDKKVFPQNNAW